MKRFLFRCLLGILILLNIGMIIGFSSESAAQSNETSKKVTEGVAQVVVKDYADKPADEQNAILKDMHPSVRTMAHMAEFASLAFLILLFIKTFPVHLIIGTVASLLSTLLCAIGDELYQHLANDGRAGEAKDVLFDMLGATVGCTILLLLILIVYLCRKRAAKKPLKVTHYTVLTDKRITPLRIAVAADIHDNPHGRVLDALQAEQPDLILVTGDLTDDKQIREGGARALEFLQACSDLAPTFYSLGNHEIACYHKGNPFRHPIPIPVDKAFGEAVAQAGAPLLDNSGEHWNEHLIFGLTSGIHGKKNEPDAKALEQFASEKGNLKLLLCHHPEYYMPYLKATDADLVVCGHAHGGHWRFFRRGVYAPGQGLLPKYTSGVVDSRCVISRGIGNHTSIPRLFNPTELVMVTLKTRV